MSLIDARDSYPAPRWEGVGNGEVRSQLKLAMRLTRIKGWGLFLAIWGLALIASVPLMDSNILVALLGLGFIYYGASMVRSGSFTV